MRKTKQKTCECCGKELEISFSSTKYCSSCAVCTYKLKQRIAYLERRSNKYRDKYNKLKEKMEKWQ